MREKIELLMDIFNELAKIAFFTAFSYLLVMICAISILDIFNNLFN